MALTPAQITALLAQWDHVHDLQYACPVCGCCVHTLHIQQHIRWHRHIDN